MQDFKDGAEAVVWKRGSCIAVGQTANRSVPALHTLRGAGRWRLGCILSRGVHLVPVFDIACCIILPILTRFVQDRVPFVIIRIAVFIGVAARLVLASYGWCAKRIAYISAVIVFSENKACRIQIKPAHAMGHGVIRNEQAVVAGIAILCAAARCGRRGLRRACHTAGIAAQRIGIHCAGVGKRHIMQGAVRQLAVCRAGNIHRRKVEIVSAAGGKGELLLDLILHRQRNVCESAGEVGHFIAVVLLVEDLERICSLSKRRDRELCRAIFVRERGRAAAIIRRVACRVQNHGGNVFVCAGLSAGIANLYRSASGVRGKICGRHSKAAAGAVQKRQLPLVSCIFGDLCQPAGRLAALGCGDKENVISCGRKVHRRTNRRRVITPITHQAGIFANHKR